MPDTPPTLAWLPDFAASIGRASLGSLASWEVKGADDPLRWYVTLTFYYDIPKYAPSLLRGLLEQWADANNCVYRRSEFKGCVFRALILLKGLRPESRISPFDEVKRGQNRRAR